MPTQNNTIMEFLKSRKNKVAQRVGGKRKGKKTRSSRKRRGGLLADASVPATLLLLNQYMKKRIKVEK